VEADALKAEDFRSQLLPGQDVSLVVEVLAATNDESVPWHHFNDARLNGPNDITYWQDRYPNLRQISTETRSSRCLADLLSSWMTTRQTPTEPALLLHLNQGNLIPTLEGLGPWMQRLESVQLALPGAKGSWMPELDAWLAYRGFAAVTERPGTWQRDPLATALLLLRQRDQQVLNLTQKQAELISQRDAAQTIEAELIAQRDAAQTLEAELISQRDAAQTLEADLVAQRDAAKTLEADLIAQRDAAQTLEADLITQRDAAKTLEADLIAQRDAAQTLEAELIAQRDGLGARAEQLQGGLDWLLGEIAQLRFLVDQAVAHDPTAIPEIAVPAPAESA
jgi:hypothetical protein